MLAVSVLGPLRASVDGTSVDVGSGRQRRVIAALAVRFPHTVPVSTLVDAVFGDDPPAGAVSTLQSYISRVRSTLGRDAVIREHGGYRLDGDATVDAVEVQALLDDAHASISSNPARAAATAESALRRWNGPALGELAEVDWFTATAVQLARTRARLEYVHATALVNAGQLNEAVDALSSMVAAAPLDEPAQALLIRSLAACGRTLEATRRASAYRRQLRAETGLDPSPDFAALERAVLAGEVAPAAELSPSPPGAPGVPPTLPPTSRPAVRLARPARLVGRTAELDELRRALDDARLVTVLGTGGVGKTRLIAEFVAEIDADSHVVAELSATGPDDVVAAIGDALGSRSQLIDGTTIVELIGERSLLLVLDNCEHVVEPVRALVRRILDACRRARVLTTSRTRLALPDEQVLPLHPLATSGDHAPAVELFTQCLRRSRSAADVDTDSPDVARLCEQLDGLPLAIELAASRASVLGITTISDHLTRSVDLLARPVAAGDGRHASVDHVVRWSYDLLGAAAQELFAALSVFEDEFDLDAVLEVGSAVLEQAAGPVFERLIDTSLVALGRSPGHFRLLAVVRRVAEAHLVAGGSEVTVRRAHARWVAGQAEHLSDLAAGSDDASVSDRLRALRADARRAIDHSLATGDHGTLADLASGLAGILIYRPDADLAARMVRAAEAQPPNAALAPLPAAGSRAAWLVGDLDRADELARRVLRIDRDDDGGSRARARHTLGVLALYDGRFHDAEREFATVVGDDRASRADHFDALGGAALGATYGGRLDDAAIHLARQRTIADALGNHAFAAFTDYVEAELALARGDSQRSMILLRRSADTAWETGATFVWGLASTVLASQLVAAGADGEVASQLPTLLERWRTTATWPQLWTALRLSAFVLATAGRLDDAATILAAAADHPSAPEVPAAERTRIDDIWAALSDEGGAQATDAARARGSMLERHEVLELAMRSLGSVAAP